MRFLSFLALLLIISPVLAVNQHPKYVGYKHKGVVAGETLPNGVKQLSGGLLSNEDYGVSRFSKGNKYMLWLEHITTRDAAGVPSWEVKDVLTFKNLKNTQEFFLGLTSPCTQNGKPNFDLIVKTELLKNKTYKVVDAWIADVKKNKFKDVSEKGIKCEYIAGN